MRLDPIVAIALPVLSILTLAGCAEPDARAAAASGTSRAEPGGRTAPEAGGPLEGWPPRLGQPYPDLELHDTQGNPVRLASFRGKVLLIEPIGMGCPACNAFAGAGEPGVPGFDGVRPQKGLMPVAQMLPAYAGGVGLDHPELVFVQLLLYDMKLNAPSLEDARRWGEHFGVERPNHHVLYGDERLLNPDSYNMIPGFQVVDRDSILRADSTGHRPRQNLYTELLPLLGELLQGG